MLSRLLRAGDDGTRGGSTAAGKPLPFYVRETTAGGGEDRGHRSPCLLLDERLRSDKTFSSRCALNNMGRLMNESGI